MKVKLIALLIISNISYGIALSKVSKPFEKPILKNGEVVSKVVRKESSKNIDDILLEAVNNGRITSIDKYKLYILYSKWKEGIKFLSRCLNTKNCNPYKFYKEVYNKPQLYKYIYLKYPGISSTLLMHKVGEVNEKIMDKYFARTGWKKINGEIGRNGVDGLYVKYDKKGNIKDVLIVEAKYNNSQLNTTKDGSKQMSTNWTLKKLDNLIQKYPEKKRSILQ